MPFWTYMLHCRGGYFYTGHTDNLEVRIGAHEIGTVDGFSKDHLPVSLVWSQEFPSRTEALAMERRIKGWSRVKKLALIRGDWDEISRLSSKNGSPSTSSGRTGRDWHPLLRHPDSPASAIATVEARVSRLRSDALVFDYRIRGSVARIALPSQQSSVRTDELWRTTCLEAFIGLEGSAYLEMNFSPSSRWAAYRFDAYREGMRNARLPAQPKIAVSRHEDRIELHAKTSMPSDVASVHWRIGLSAVIERTDGTKSYWALAHPPGKPDFHHSHCFTLDLPPPSAA